MRRALAATLLVTFAFAACTGSNDGDPGSPSIGGINGPAVVDPSFDPFATDPSAPSLTDGG